MMNGIEVLRNRSREAHKGDFGRLLVIAGSTGFSGAAGLAGFSALRTGAGLVTAAVPQSIYPILAGRFVELMYLPLPERDGALCPDSLPLIEKILPKTDCLLIGPGLNTNGEVRNFVGQLLPIIDKPLVLDADGLNCIAEAPQVLKKIKAPVIVTPHPGEMSRLTGRPIAEIQRNRQEIAEGFSREYEVITVLKGYRTVVIGADDAEYLNLNGNPGMATAGSGDVLAGIIAGLLAQGISAFNAARLGVYLHGLAGDLAAGKTNQPSLTAGDILANIPAAISFLLANS